MIADLAWLAGIIDGEGCIRIAIVKAPRGHNYVVTLGIVNTSLRIINRVRDISVALGAKSNTYSRFPTSSKGRPIWEIRFLGRHTKRVLEAALPYLTGKADQAQTVLDYYSWRDGFNPSAKRDGSLAAEAERIVRQYAARLHTQKVV